MANPALANTNIVALRPTKRARHYLEAELYSLLGTDSDFFDFLDAGSVDGLWYWDLENPDHEWMSRGFWSTLGFDPRAKRHLVKEWQDLVNPDDLETTKRNFALHCDDPNHPYDQIVRYRHADGHTVWIRCRGKAIRNAAGKPIRMLGAHSDVTALKEAEASMRRKSTELETANQALAKKHEEVTNENLSLSGFSTMAAHDLKEPMRHISTYAALLERRLPITVSDEVRELLKTIGTAARRGNAMVDALLKMSQLPEDTSSFRRVNAAAAFAMATQNLGAADGFGDVELTCGELPTVYGDVQELAQVFQNLIANGVTYNESSPKTLHVSASQAGERWIINVKDNGIGIAPEHHHSLFEPFRRLHSKDKYEGTGFGLTIAKRIVERHGGEIWIESTPADGTTFRFSLPILDESE